MYERWTGAFPLREEAVDGRRQVNGDISGIEGRPGEDRAASTKQWQRLRELFDEAKDLAANERRQFLERECPDDAELRGEVARLLGVRDQEDDYFDRPLVAGEELLDWLEKRSVASEPGLAGLRVKDRYEIEEQIGHSGFSTVYRARDTLLADKPVVVKILSRGVAAPDWLDRHFGQEIAAMARVDHPGVVGVLDAGELDDGRPFLVLQFVPGPTLRQVLDRGPALCVRAANWIGDLGRALGAAHAKGVLHRDLKPENIIIREDGTDPERAVVIDFGIASVRGLGDRETHPTAAVGTPSYMAPEQAHGAVSRRTDVYALGLIVFEMLTGVRATAAVEPTGPAFAADLGEKLALLRPDVPARASSLLVSALSWDSAARPADVQAWSENLAAALSGRTPAPEPVRRRTALFAAFAVPIAILAGFVGWRFLDRGGQPAASPPVPGIACFLVPASSRGALVEGKPFLPSPDQIFLRGDRLRLGLRASAAGILHLFSQSIQNGKPARDLTLLLPEGTIQTPAEQTIWVPANPKAWLEFDGSKGVDRIWVVWSREQVRTLQDLRLPQLAGDQGTIRDPAALRILREFLVPSPDVQLNRIRDDAGERMSLRLQAGALVYPLDLRHE